MTRIDLPQDRAACGENSFSLKKQSHCSRKVTCGDRDSDSFSG
jgi:hypothetical protein